MHPAVEKLVVALIIALVSGAVGWTYTIHARVAALETERAGMAGNIEVIRQDVRELRRKLLRDVP